MYLSIIFTVSVCWWLGFLAYWLAIDVAKAMSGLVSTIENIRDPVMPWYRSLSDVGASWLGECTFLHRGVDGVCFVKVELGEDFVDVRGLGQFDGLLFSVSLYL